jgi:uncharacterized membrane protein YdjX (TVP38/TMEM64 family)
MKPSIFAAVLVVLAVGGLAVAIFAGPHRAAAALLGLNAELRRMGWAGWLLFIAVEFAITLVGIIPGSLLGILAGAVYGISAGFIASACGIVLGAYCAFALSRGALRPLIAGLLRRHNRLNQLDSLVAKDSWRLVALLRVSPVMPFSITSYALGLSGIRQRDYLIGTLASLPPLLGYVIIGALGGAGFTAKTQTEAVIHAALLGLGILATIALTVHLSRLLARALRTA